MRQHLRSIIAIGLAGLAAAAANAFDTIAPWLSNNVVMRASAVSFPAGSAYRTALGTVTSRYYNNPSKFWFTQQYDDTSVGFSNGQNEVWFSSSSQYSPAVCFPTVSWFGFMTEADVIFYNGEAYTTSMNKTSLWGYGGAYRPFQTTAMHEYGHAAGLAHENGEYNIMGRDWEHIHLNGATCRSYVGEDACDGLVSLYGLVGGSGFQDVSVTHWKYYGASGQYSDHILCKMYSSTGAELPWTSFNGQRRYNVNKGQVVKVEFTYENNGQSSQSPQVGIYRSVDANITTADTLMLTVTPTLGRADVMTTSYNITIPTSLVSGSTYYIGAIVDRNNAIAEVDEANNAAYHIIRVN